MEKKKEKTTKKEMDVLLRNITNEFYKHQIPKKDQVTVIKRVIKFLNIDLEENFESIEIEKLIREKIKIFSPLLDDKNKYIIKKDKFGRLLEIDDSEPSEITFYFEKDSEITFYKTPKGDFLCNERFNDDEGDDEGFEEQCSIEGVEIFFKNFKAYAFQEYVL